MVVYSDNSVGTGTLTVTGANTVTWKAPGDTVAGEEIPIVHGGQEIVTGKADESAGRILIKRTTSDDLDTDEAATVAYNGRLSAYEELQEVQASLSRTRKAQQSGEGDVSLRSAELRDLEASADKLRKRVDIELGTNIRFMTPDFSNM